MGKNACHAAIAVLVTMGSGVLVAAGSLRITSPDFQPNATLPRSATCDGAGQNPELQFGGAPPSAKSLVLIVVDPDVPRSIKSDGRYLHWARWDLPPDTSKIAEGRDGRGLNEIGRGTYIPACPPNGEHRYVFQLYALDTLIGNARIASEGDLRLAMDGHVLDQAELVGRYTTRAFRVMRVVVGMIMLLVVYLVVRRVVAHRPLKATLTID
jgi:Raf kinase inhibitor-like YbhB/YbcL family protein